MSASGILIMIGGEPIDLYDVTWCCVAPCGCTSGMTVGFGNYGSSPAHVVANADQAAAQFWETEVERAKYARLGFTFRPVHRLKAPTMVCKHDPKWGYSIPTPDGLTWAVGGYYGQRSKVLHLVPSEAVADRDNREVYETARTLCGTQNRPWTKEPHVRDGKVECTKCLSKAAAQLEAVPA